MKLSRIYLTIVLCCSLHMAISANGEPSTRKNIILISMDQLSAKHVHTYGYPRKTTPNIDAMAGGGVQFNQFYANGSYTVPSYGSMFTGLFPSQNRITLFGDANPDLTYVTEILKESGYHTVAFNNNVVSSEVVRKGFDEYYLGQVSYINITERTGIDLMDSKAPAANQRVFSWLEKNKDTPFFLFLLYFEPHSPYDPPPEHDIFKTEAYPEETQTGYDPEKGKLLRLANCGDRMAVQRLIDLYDGKVHFVDHYFGELMDKLKALSLDKSTVVLLVADHGELLYSHPDVLTFDHRSLYDTNIQVPLVIKGPGIPEGKKMDALASLIDIPPTLLDIAGLPPMENIEGKSLMPLIRDKVSSIHDYVFMEQDVGDPMRSVRDGQWKLILNLLSGKKQLFDICSDPGEMVDVLVQYPEMTARLSGVLEQWMKKTNLPQDRLIESWRNRTDSVPAPLATFLGGDLIVDEVATGCQLQLNGPGWQTAQQESNYKGYCYWTYPGLGDRSALWRSDNPMLGVYEVYVWYGSIPDRKAATRASYCIRTRKGEKRTYIIDQNQNQGKWNLLGTYKDPLNVTLTDLADGPIIVDAVKFHRIGN